MNCDREGTSLIFYISHAWRSLTSTFINSLRRKSHSLPFVSSSSAFFHLFFFLSFQYWQNLMSFQGRFYWAEQWTQDLNPRVPNEKHLSSHIMSEGMSPWLPSSYNYHQGFCFWIISQGIMDPKRKFHAINKKYHFWPVIFKVEKDRKRKHE